jgi:DNA-binding Lrp family transcriptional regulator
MKSKYQKKLDHEKALKAFQLHKQGLTLRSIAAVLNMSHEWVRQKVKELEAIKNNKY